MEISRSMIVALIPSVVAAIYITGISALYVVLASVLAAIVTETGIQRFRSKKITISDGTATVTGLILALLLPLNVPLWIPVAGAVFGVAIVKQAFGGHGHNIFNPAAGGWIFLTMSWSAYTVTSPRLPTAMLFNQDAIKLVGASPIAILLGGAYLLARGRINWQAPIGFISTTLLVTPFFDQAYYLTGIFALFAFFIVTDPVTTPAAGKGRVLFGVGCGILTAVYSFYGSYAEGLALSVLLMNVLTPWIDRFTKPMEGATSA